MKKLLAIFALVLTATLLFTLTAYANDIQVVVSGEPVTFSDQTPVIVGGRTLVPIRDVFEAMGFDIDWNSETRTVTLERDDDIVVIVIDSDTFTTNGESIDLDVPAQIIGGRTMLPLRAVLESVGYELDWDGAEQTVIITSAEQPTTNRPARDPISGALFGYGDDGIAEMQYNARILFEQTIFPREVFQSENVWVELITTSNLLYTEGLVLSLWEFAAATVILNDYLLSGGEEPDYASEIWELSDERRPLFGLGDEHIVDISIVRINADTNAVIVEMLDISRTLVSTFIGISYNETDGLRFFTLERSLDFLGDGNVPHMLCFITPYGRGNFGIIVGNNRDDFISALRLVINETEDAA